MTIALIGVPTSAGSHGPGQEKAPQALRRAGLVEGLRAAGLEVEDHGDLPTARYQARAADPRQRNLDDVVEVAGRVADQVHAVLDRGQRPLLLGGGAPALAGIGPRTPLLAPDRLLLFGYDDPDDLGEPQQALLARHAPAAWPATRARVVPGGPRAAAAAALAELEARSGTVVVHFDVDVVDSGDLPLANFPHFG